jgi:hypothetical protein
MNDKMKIAIRWLAIADLALFIIVLVVGVLAGKVLSNSVSFDIPLPGCPSPPVCHIGSGSISVNPVLIIGTVLAAVVSALRLGSRGIHRVWLVLLLILTVLLVLSPIALYLLREDTAVVVMSAVAALASLIALVATFGSGIIKSS